MTDVKTRLKRMTRFKYVAFGIGCNPFWWQWGDVSWQCRTGRMVAVGPFRIAWRFCH
jgi:hypothetical protein